MMWTTVLELWIPGVPVPQGSKKGFVAGKRAIIVDANPEQLKPWRAQVSACAVEAWGGRPSLDEPVNLFAEFTFPRLKSHYGTGRNAGVLKPDAPFYKTSSPDKDKLERAINDGLTDAGVWKDDALVCDGGSRKVYGPKPGVRVWVQTIKETTTCEQ